MDNDQIDFCEVSLGEVCFESISQDGPVGPFLYIDIGSIDRLSKTIVDPKKLPLEAAPSRAKQVLHEGDVLVSMTRPNLNAVAIVPSNLSPSIGSTGFHVLRSKWVKPEFLYYLVQTDSFIEAMSSVVQGALYPAVRPKDILSFKFLLPPSLTQTRIVEKLEELFSDLDAGVAELKAAQKKLAQYRQSLLKSAVEGALTAEWRSKNKPKETGAQLLERILKERRARWEEKQLARFKEQGKTPPKGWQDKYPQPVQPDTTNLPELPEGWVWASVDCLLSEIETGKSFKCDERPPKVDEVGVVKVSAVTWGEYNEQESKTCTDPDRVNDALFVRPGDFLFSRANTIELVGACVIAEKVTLNVMLSDKILRFVLVEENTKRWLLFLLRSESGRAQIEELASGNQESMRNIGQERIRQISIPLPPSIEIQQILSILESNFEAAIAQSNAINVGLKQSAAQRKNTLKTAFSGQLVPQDPHDEPASLLLERIRAERAASDSDTRKRGSRKKVAKL